MHRAAERELPVFCADEEEGDRGKGRSMNFDGLTTYMQSLLGKEVTIVFSNGDHIVGNLKDLLPDAVILDGDGLSICSIANINLICEGKWAQ